jgi:hypothetical protein
MTTFRPIMLLIGCLIFKILGGITPVTGLEKQAVAFSYRFFPGLKLAYHLVVKGTVAVRTPQGTNINPIHITMDIEQEVVEMAGDKARVGVTVKSARTISGSDSAPLPEEGQYSTMLIDPQGRTEYVSGTGGWKGSEFSQLIFPQRPLQEGQSWLQESSSQIGAPTISKSKFTFRGFEALKDHRCALFTSTLDVDSPTNPFQEKSAETTARILFSPEVGQLIHMTADSEFSFTMPLSQTGHEKAVTTTKLRIEMRLDGF